MLYQNIFFQELLFLWFDGPNSEGGNKIGAPQWKDRSCIAEEFLRLMKGSLVVGKRGAISIVRIGDFNPQYKKQNVALVERFMIHNNFETPNSYNLERKSDSKPRKNRFNIGFEVCTLPWKVTCWCDVLRYQVYSFAKSTQAKDHVFFKCHRHPFKQFEY